MTNYTGLTDDELIDEHWKFCTPDTRAELRRRMTPAPTGEVGELLDTLEGHFKWCVGGCEGAR